MGDERIRRGVLEYSTMLDLHPTSKGRIASGYDFCSCHECSTVCNKDCVQTRRLDTDLVVN
jgi:hypothetical protein